MKKQDLKKLALMGITGGLLLGSQAANADQDSAMEMDNINQMIAGKSGQGCGGPSGCGGTTNGKNGNNNGKNGNANSNGRNGNNNNAMPHGGRVANEKYMDDEALMKQLNPQMKKTYENLSPEGKALALKLANQACKGLNECKGQNSCKSDENECAGKASCKGHGKCSFKDKNMAVKVAADKMAEKRNKLHNQ